MALWPAKVGTTSTWWRAHAEVRGRRRVEGVIGEQRVQLAQQRRTLRRATLQLGILQLGLQLGRQAHRMQHLRRCREQAAVGVPESTPRAGGRLENRQCQSHVPRGTAPVHLLAHLVAQVARRLPHAVRLSDEPTTHA